MKTRIGHGYDAHRLVPGRELWLGGILIPYELGLDGHSDADVLIHAICDALLGALALGDIGKHFPESNATYKDIDSKILLKKVKGMLDERGWEILNIDSTLLLEAPKLAPYIRDMRKTLAGLLQIDLSDVSVKATTTEGLGFEGRGEGISAHALVLISRT
ncbi:MAG: 2-C-methyl-D-erythritol 2,4-cyclodiphosphate synthase [Bacteroidetes bacterium]|nr:2-C-methyl-D-erythritol 2,4-cyclodiphosphate synthase [Bacteroidota bacterium]